MASAKVEEAFYSNGQLEWEAMIKDGKPVGMVRHWYENGMPERECPYDGDGLKHGIVKDWNKQGKLLGEFQWDHGTGVSKNWFKNDQLRSEHYYIRGKRCGRSIIWWEDGGVMSVTYYINNREVSKKKYDEACKANPALPRYEDNEPEPEDALPPVKYKTREAPVSEWDRHKHDEFINKFLHQPNRGEARQWLAGDENRNIGEMRPEESREFIEEGYKAGATKILAVEIKGDTTNCLIVYLPSVRPKRERVFEWSGEAAQRCGFDPYEDWGQNEFFVYFS